MSKLIKEANADMVFGEEEAKLFQEAATCHICDKELTVEKIRETRSFV